MKRKLVLGLLYLSLAMLASVAQARDNKVDFGAYEVHYSAFPSTFLHADVAAANKLNRSRGIGIVNIAIMAKTDNGDLRPVTGQVEGQVLNDVGQPRFLGFRRIQEGESVYFISEYQYSPGELMTFQITARPTGHSNDLSIRFSQTLYGD